MSEYYLAKNGYMVVASDHRRYQHREVWTQHNGPIPAGYVIHHKNGIKTDNRIENLECLPDLEHRKLHSNTPENIALILSVRDGPQRDFICEECGKSGTTTSRVKRFCCRKCTMRFNNRILSRQRLTARHAAKELSYAC